MEVGLPIGMIAGMVMMFGGVIGWVYIIMLQFDKVAESNEMRF